LSTEVIAVAVKN